MSGSEDRKWSEIIIIIKYCSSLAITECLIIGVQCYSYEGLKDHQHFAVRDLIDENVSSVDDFIAYKALPRVKRYIIMILHLLHMNGSFTLSVLTSSLDININP